MRENLASTLAYIDEDEGPEVNISPGEPGGASARGLSLEVLAEYNAAHGLPKPVIADMYKVTAVSAGQVYVWRFLDPLNFDALPTGVDYRMADAAITLGGSGAALILQMALKMYPMTGIIDAATIAAVTKADPKIIIEALDTAWLAWKHGLSPDGWAKFQHGWVNRVKTVNARAMKMLEQ